jgi:hypothetical protein
MFEEGSILVPEEPGGVAGRRPNGKCRLRQVRVNLKNGKGISPDWVIQFMSRKTGAMTTMFTVMRKILSRLQLIRVSAGPHSGHGSHPMLIKCPRYLAVDELSR